MVTIEAGELRLVLNPKVGGSIRSLSRSDHAILRHAASDGDVLDAASFPLVPYVNRIRGGRFTFREREVVLRPNMAGDASPLHGQGWLNPWAVESQDVGRATLMYRHERDEWPWRYEAVQEFRLEADGLWLRLTCSNMDEEPMPCGLGQHPYFPCGPQTRIDTEVTHVWTIDDDVLPVERVAAEGRFDLCDRLVCGQSLDHGFTGWAGTAILTDPDWPCAVRMSSSDARFFQLYSPAAGGIFVAEPVTHANAALNALEEEWASLGLRVLDPGEAMHLDMRLDVTAK